MITLKNKYKGQILNIVGKGPSLRYLKTEHFIPGPIVTINHAIIAVEQFNFDDVYSMQKDGGNRRISLSQQDLNPSCEHSGDCGDTCGGMTRPKKATLLVHRHESLFCFPEYKPRVVFDWDLLGLPGNENSMIFSIQIGKLFGCTGFRFISFDMHTHGDNRTYIPGMIEDMPNNPYQSQVPKIAQYINGFDSIWVTPKKEQE